MPLLRDRLLLAALAASLCMAGVGGWLIAGPSTEAAPESSPIGFAALGSPSGSALPTPPGTIVVDVEGAVARPGIIELPAGSRIADAVRAAGGYTDAADLLAAASQLNLAAELTDGAQVIVPVIGATPPAGGGGPSAFGGSATGLIDLNSATPEQLDTLPGIGPVTVQKIVAARTERPFASLEEAVERGVLNNGQLEKIRDLATVT